jgi:DNA-binding CsgD family transcriptional regulator
MLSGVEALTPSERRVADLAAEGLTTRQIAEALFVTPKTVEFHLRNTYQKLDIGSRPSWPARWRRVASSDVETGRRGAPPVGPGPPHLPRSTGCPQAPLPSARP